MSVRGSKKPVTKPVPMREGRNGGRLRTGGTSKGGTGRPPSVLRAQLRGSFADRIKILEKVADDEKASPSDRIKALDMMAKYGLGTTSTSTDAEGNDAPVPGQLSPAEIEAEVRRILGQ